MAEYPTPILRRLLLVEDDRLTRGLIAALLRDGGFDVADCGTASDAAELAAQFDPDAMVVDISLGSGPTGIDLIHAMRNAYPHIAFVVLSNYAALPSAVRDLGNVAYLRKSDVSDPGMVLRAVEEVLRDVDASQRFPLHQPTQLDGLTQAQIEVLALIAAGLSNLEIAARRGTTVQSTEQLISRVYRALGLNRGSAMSMRVQASKIYSETLGTPGSS